MNKEATKADNLILVGALQGTEVIRHEFTAQEHADMRDTITQNLIKLQTKQEALKEVKDQFKEEMAPLVNENKKLLKNVVQGFIDKEVLCNLVTDYDNRIMEMYDPATGEKIGERRLMISEMQGDLFSK